MGFVGILVQVIGAIPELVKAGKAIAKEAKGVDQQAAEPGGGAAPGAGSTAAFAYMKGRFDEADRRRSEALMKKMTSSARERLDRDE